MGYAEPLPSTRQKTMMMSSTGAGSAASTGAPGRWLAIWESGVAVGAEHCPGAKFHTWRTNSPHLRMAAENQNLTVKL